MLTPIRQNCLLRRLGKGEIMSVSVAPTNQHSVNYFPVNNGGYQMWSSYNGPQYQKDMQTSKNLGFNTMRVFLAAAGGIFDFSKPSAAELANLTDFYNRSVKVGIKLHLTLFDLWGNYGLINGSCTWIRAVLGALPNTANIAVIEIQNETRYSLTSPYSGGFDSGWPAGTTQYSQVGQVAIVWAQQIIPYVRSVAPGVLVTSSTSYGTADLAAFFAAVNKTGAAPSWYDWHCYTGSSSLVYSAIQGAVSVVGNPATLYIGETGLSSTSSGTQGTLQAQQAESDYIQAVRWSCAQLGIPDPSPWILFDMNNSAQFPGGQTYGLYDAAGNVKLAAVMYEAIPAGVTVPAISINGTMQGSQLDTGGNALPVRWSLYKGQKGTQPIDATIDTTNTYQGNPTILLTGSGATSGTDNPPALQSCPFTLPIISQGQSYAFSCALKASGAYGTPCLEISWYNSTGGYITSTNGTPLTLGGSFTRYTLNGTAPATSAYAWLFVNVPGNAGHIWVGGATWA
jgi:hypothetical protein